jgi:hypothetical protein
MKASAAPFRPLRAADVDAAYRIAVDAGCEPLAAPADKPQGQRVGYVRDPFGMLVELATPLKMSPREWGSEVPFSLCVRSKRFGGGQGRCRKGRPAHVVAKRHLALAMGERQRRA